MANSGPNSNASGGSSNLIYQQIQQDAKYYAPGVYQGLLTYHDSLTLGTDSVAQQFVPVSDIYANDNKGRLFVVGMIPPSATVTGAAIDRSGTVATVNSSNGSASGSGSTADGSRVLEGVQGQNQGPSVPQTLSISQVSTAISGAYQQQFGHPPTSQELAMYVSQSYKETGNGYGQFNWPSNNPGFIGNYKNPPAGSQTFLWGDGSYYNAYPSAQAGAQSFVQTLYKCGGQAAITAAQNGDATAYAQALSNGGYMQDPVNDYAGTINKNLPYFTGQVQGPNARNATLPPPITLGPMDQVSTSTSTNWQSTGSSSASQAQTQQSIGSNTNLGNTTTTAQKFAQAQRDMVVKTQKLLSQMANTPPLKFLTNPASFKVNNEKVISQGNWTRYGPSPVVEHWGDGQDKIEGSGKIAAFMAIDVSGQTAQAPGITRTARQYSASYQNFLSLYLLYKNNAGLNIQDAIDGNKTNLSMLGSIYIYYDHTMYIGSFDEFTVSEADTAPYTLDYTFSFTVRATFILDQIADPNHTYGIPQGGFTVAQPATVQTTQSATLSSGVAASGVTGNDTGDA